MQPKGETSRHLECNPTKKRFGEVRLGNKGRWEYLRAIYERYQEAGRKDQKAIANEFWANAGYQRKVSSLSHRHGGDGTFTVP
jgi:hypothetical protein